jgi:tripartite-type tricarboxylate transporter receptor subunit TctC
MGRPTVEVLSRRELIAGLGASALSAGLATNARADDFYAGKTFTVIVGFAPGGGVDTVSRLCARHLVRFIPGKPALVVQNMEGAAGVVAANYVARRVAPDGLTLSFPGRSWYVYGVVKNPGVAFDPATFTYIGSPGAVNSMLYVRASTGIKTFEDLRKSSKTLTVGSLGSSTPTAMIPNMLAGLGVPIKVVYGYVSTARVLLALEQGEIDGVFTVDDSFARRQDLLTKKIVLPILQNKPTHPGLPVLRDILPKSTAPLLKLALALEDFGLPLVGPPGMPADRVALLRKAFLAMCADKDYQTEARKIDQPIGAPLDGAQLDSMIDDLVKAATPDVVAAYKRLAAAK